MVIEIDGARPTSSRVAFTVEDTGGFQAFRPRTVGRVTIGETGDSSGLLSRLAAGPGDDPLGLGAEIGIPSGSRHDEPLAGLPIAVGLLQIRPHLGEDRHHPVFAAGMVLDLGRVDVDRRQFIARPLNRVAFERAPGRARPRRLAALCCGST